nr:hypothetical protein [uncultured Halomonas sp.]
MATRGRLVLHGLQGGNETPFPTCAAFEEVVEAHCYLEACYPRRGRVVLKV